MMYTNYYGQPTFKTHHIISMLILVYHNIYLRLMMMVLQRSQFLGSSCYKALGSVLIMAVEVQFLQIVLTSPLRHMTL